MNSTLFTLLILVWRLITTNGTPEKYIGSLGEVFWAQKTFISARTDLSVKFVKKKTIITIVIISSRIHGGAKSDFLDQPFHRSVDYINISEHFILPEVYIGNHLQHQYAGVWSVSIMNNKILPFESFIGYI